MSEETQTQQTPTAPPLTAAEELALEQARLQRLTAERELKELETAHQSELDRRDALNRKQHVSAAIKESGFDFYDVETIEKLLESYNINATGQGFLNGRKCDALSIVRHVVEQRPFLARNAAQAQKQPEPDTRAKSEFSQQQKIAFITEHGIDAWERLPLYATRVVDVDSREMYSRLSNAQKMKIVSERGADFDRWLAALPRKSR